MELRDTLSLNMRAVSTSSRDQKATESAGVNFEWAKDFFGWEDADAEVAVSS